jgi:hypothetical protein
MNNEVGIMFLIGLLIGTAAALAVGLIQGSTIGYERCLMDIKQEGLPFIQKKWEFDHRIRR